MEHSCVARLPAAVLDLVLSFVCSVPRDLFRLGSVCRSFRAVIGSAGCSPALVDLWLEVLSWLDPSAGLLPPRVQLGAGAHSMPTEERATLLYQAHACMQPTTGARVGCGASTGGWHVLAHALASRECWDCGDVTRFVAWSYDEAAIATAAATHQGVLGSQACVGPVRCCPGCELPCDKDSHGGGSVDGDEAVVSGDGGGGDEAREGDGSCGGAEAVGSRTATAKRAGKQPCRRTAAVINRLFFDAEPSKTLDAAQLGGGKAAAEALQAALWEACEGDTIEVRGQFDVTPVNCLVAVASAAFRLVGRPASSPDGWRLVHEGVDSEAMEWLPESHWWCKLLRHEHESAEALGFPSAGIHGRINSIQVSAPIWLEGLYLSGGDRGIGRNGVDEATGPDNWQSMEWGAAVWCAAELKSKPQAALAPCVLQRCWLTGYNGAGLTLSPGAKAAMLRCAVTNCAGVAAYCNDGGTLRMRGCRLTCNMSAVEGIRAASPRLCRAVAEANHCQENFLEAGQALCSNFNLGCADVLMLV